MPIISTFYFHIKYSSLDLALINPLILTVAIFNYVEELSLG